MIPGLLNQASLLNNLSVLDVLEFPADSYEPGAAARFEEMLNQVGPEHQKRSVAHSDAEAYEGQLMGIIPELEEMVIQAKRESQHLLVSSMSEIISNTSASDVRGLAEVLRPVQDKTALIEEALNLLHYRRIPAARLSRLEAALSLRKIEELEFSLLAAISGAKTLERLIASGVYEGGNRIALVDERTETVRAAAREAQRQVALAEEVLRDERKRQLTSEQTRFASGQITKAEIAASAVQVRAA